jgi:hypothetical protein
VSDRGERVGVNEALFREVNERIEDLQEHLGQGRSFEIVCECGDAECMERFAITNDAYAALRSDVHRFAVVPGHELPDLERTVERHESYSVVEKADPEAAEAAEKLA